MYKFHVNGDVGRHFISISGAAAECGISISTINRQEKKGEFPPKQKNSEIARLYFLCIRSSNGYKDKEEDGNNDFYILC